MEGDESTLSRCGAGGYENLSSEDLFLFAQTVSPLRQWSSWNLQTARAPEVVHARVNQPPRVRFDRAHVSGELFSRSFSDEKVLQPLSDTAVRRTCGSPWWGRRWQCFHLVLSPSDRYGWYSSRRRNVKRLNSHSVLYDPANIKAPALSDASFHHFRGCSKII